MIDPPSPTASPPCIASGTAPLPDNPSVRAALTYARSLGLARLDAHMLLLHALGRSVHDRAWLMAHDDAVLDAASARQFARHCAARLDAVPVAYLCGEREFFGLTLNVDARVLVPRPDTEILVQWALELLPPESVQASGPPCSPAPVQVADLGTGSGAVAIAIAHTRPDVQVLAVDASDDALQVARANAQRLGLRNLRCARSDWLHGVSGRFHLIASNPPYIRTGDPHLPALRHEPAQALTSGADGLDDIRRIIEQAAAHLHPGGWLLLEHGWDQAPQVQALLCAQGFAQVQTRRDLADHPRCTGGCRGEMPR